MTAAISPTTANVPIPVLLVKSGGVEALAEWKACIEKYITGIAIHWWDDPDIDPVTVHYALVWEPEPGRLAQYPNLKAVISSAAGVDHILTDPLLPPNLPIIRMVTEDTVRRMSEFVAMSCLMLLKDMPRMMQQQQDKVWQEVSTSHTAAHTRVGVMGLGALGQAAAEMLARIGFDTAGWARSPHQMHGVTCFIGQAAFAEFIARTDILVCLLPNTEQTRGIINQNLLAQLPTGAAIINVGRGNHVCLDDLLAALDAKHISRALLDVFDEEPLPKDNPVWTHPSIIVTPHSAATPSRLERARQVAAVIATLDKGDQPPHVYNRIQGY